MLRFLVFIILILSVGSDALAQNTTGVFGPTVSEDDHNLQYRTALDIDGEGVQWAQRLHYERALSDNFRPRLVVSAKETASREVDIDFIRLEAVWQLTPDERSHQMGIRFEGRVRTDGAEEIRANFANQWALGDGWRVRAILLNTLQVADRTNKELQFSTRLGVSRKLGSGVRLGVHGYFDLGDTAKLQTLKSGSTAELGPFISFNVLDAVDLYVGTLHGVTDGSPDNQLRLFVQRAF